MFFVKKEEEKKKKQKLFQLQKTQFQWDPSLAKKSHASLDQTPIHIYCSKDSKVIIGRGQHATVKINKGNKKVSREHVLIEYQESLKLFEMTVLSPNGVLVDHIVFMKGEHIPLLHDTLIEIVGTKLIFKEQNIPPPTKEDQLSTIMDKPIFEPLNKENLMEDNITSGSKRHHSNINQFIKSTASKIKKTARHIIKKPLSLEDEIIQILACTRKSTMTCTDITKRLGKDDSLIISKMLNNSNMIGCIQRLGKTADGTPKENLYYYKQDMDTNIERRKRYMDMGKTARKCTMKDTQYFFKIPPKLPNHKNKTQLTNKIKKKTVSYATTMEEEELNSIHSSDDDISDMEVYELFKDV